MFSGPPEDLHPKVFLTPSFEDIRDLQIIMTDKDDRNALGEEYAEFLRELTELANGYLITDPPDLLFHYTSAQGLLAILESNKVWATNLRHMNDFSELDYAHQLISEVFDEIGGSSESEPIGNFLNWCKQFFNPFETLFEGYGFCFCKEGDLLSQWREYAEKGTGYSIGFDNGLLAEALKGRTGTTVTKVIYEPVRQKEIVQNLLTVIIEEVDKVISNDTLTDVEKTAPLKHLAGHVIMAMAPLVYSFKDPAFEEENEWRIVKSLGVNEVDELKFRTSMGNLVPYFELQILIPEGKNAGKLPIKSVVQGPHVAPDTGEKALASLLKKLDYQGIDLKKSKVPLRF